MRLNKDFFEVNVGRTTRKKDTRTVGQVDIARINIMDLMDLTRVDGICQGHSLPTMIQGVFYKQVQNQ